jgi:signal transduction histidine kinase/ActR/RegA family two-component response regulator
VKQPLQKVLLFAPRGRDAEVMRKVLGAREIDTMVCMTPAELLFGLQQGASVAIATEEAFDAVESSAIDDWLKQQPTWSDFPFVVLRARDVRARAVPLQALGNVVVLERPINTETLVRATTAAVRARERQYQTRDHLEELGAARATVERLNHELESRIEERTRALAAANDRLMAEIAERERAQSALIQVQKLEAIGRLTGGIAHDFNNLLQAVSMNLELLVRMSADPRAAALAKRARNSIGRGSKLTAQLLSFARAQSLVPKVVDVRALLLDMQDLLSVSVGAAVHIDYQLGDGPAWVRLDAGQFEMALLNLAVNAKDAMPRGGKLTVSIGLAEHDDDPGAPADVVVSVADQGEGIAPNLLSKVFEPFFTTKPLGSGTGLGLSQVYGFAQQSGGSARIWSALGHGTRVDMLFPRVAAESAERDRPATRDEGAGVRRRIVVIEDDAEVRRVIVESLEMAGHSVTAAADGVHGLALVDQVEPELLIVDYAMPMMNGAEVIKAVRARRPGLPVVLATGYADMAEVGLVLGTKSILTKPFDIDELQRAVSLAMQQGDPRSGT